MGVTGPSTSAPPPATPPSRPPAWKVGGVTVVGFVALLWIVELADQLGGHQLDRNGIRPLRADGLWGVLFAPLLHADFAHLLANSGPALVLGFLTALTGLGRFLAATAVIWLGGGLGTWLIGNLGSSCGPTDHIGASGLIFGWLTFLIVLGWFTRTVWQILVGIAVFLGYGGVLWGALPVLGVCGGVSWQGHLCGALAGLLAAYLLSGTERARRAEGTR